MFLLYIVILLYWFEKSVFYGIIELSSEIDSDYKTNMTNIKGEDYGKF